MSSRLPNKHDRFSQMSEQAAIIARKKAEIEAKLKSSSSGNESNTSSDNSRKDFKPTPPGKSSKNRWYVIYTRPCFWRRRRQELKIPYMFHILESFLK